VPTRHEHGDAEVGQPHWDHYIYSCDTTDSKVAGASVEETSQALAAEAAKKNDHDKGKDKGDWVVVAPQRAVKQALAPLPVSLNEPAVLRRLRVSGKAENKDLVLEFKAAAKSAK